MTLMLLAMAATYDPEPVALTVFIYRMTCIPESA